MNYLDIHETLNALFTLANETADKLDEKNIDSQINYVAGNYLKVKEGYALQAYPIPVILIKGKGDIGFNLDGVFFEFFVKKQTAMRLSVEAFSNDYAIEVYGAEDCETDYYREGMTTEAFKRGIEKSKENGFGIAFYFDAFTDGAEAIYEAFDTCYRRILKGE